MKAAAVCLLWAMTTPGLAQTVIPGNEELLWQRLTARIGGRVERVDGLLGVWIKDLVGGGEMGFQAHRVFPTASSIKIAVLVELYRQAGDGRLSLTDRHRIGASEQTGGSGVLGQLGEDTVEMSLKDLAILMILVSDNTATNILIDRVGMDAVNGTLDRLGLGHTRLRRKMIRPEEQARGHENVSTPEELGKLVEKIYRKELLTPEACAEILDILSRPKPGPIRSRLPSEVRVAHKTGGLAGVRNDVGVVLLEGRPFVVSAMSSFMGDRQEAEDAIADVSRMAYDYFWRLSLSNADGARLPRELVKR